MDQALGIIRRGPLAGKVAGMVRELSAQVAEATGVAPAFVKVSVQMPDDSVLEMLAEPCPDGCGEVTTTPVVLPRL